MKGKIIPVYIILSLCTELAAFAQPEEIGSEDLYLAKRAFSDGFYEVALEHFQKYQQAQVEAQDNEVSLFIGRCYLNLQKFAQALRTFQEILQAGPENQFYLPAIYWTAQTYFTARDYDSAEEYFTRIITHYPQAEFLPQSYYFRACCYYQRRQFNQALQFYQQFRRKFSRHDLAAQCFFRIAQCLYNVKDYAAARKEFKAFIRRFPDSTHKNGALFYLGEVEYMRGNFRQALQYYTEAAEVEPRVKIAAFAQYARGWAYLKLGKYQEALAEFRSLQEDANLSSTLEDGIIFARARCQAHLGNYTRAIQLYDRIINEFTHSPWFDDAYFWKGSALEELGDFAAAAHIYAEAIARFSSPDSGAEEEAKPSAISARREDVSPNLVDSLRYNLGWTYARMKKYPQAIEQFNQVFAQASERFLQSGSLCRIGDIHLEQGDVTQAIKFYDSVLSDFPDAYYADYAQYQLGIAFLQKESLESARLAFNTLLTNFPQSKLLDQAHYQIARIYFRQGLFRQASTELESLIKKFPQSQLKAEAAFLCAYAYYNNQEYAQALDKLRYVLRVAEHSELKAKAQYKIGFCFYQMGKEEKAASEMERFLSLYPQSELYPDALLWLGQFYYRQKRFAQAQEKLVILREELSQGELADDAVFWQAKVLFAQQRLEPALVKLKALQTDYPHSELIPEALLFQGDIFKQQGKLNRARELYARVCREFMQTEFARLGHQKWGQILQEEGEFSRAIEQYRQALGSKSQQFNAQVQFALAACWEKQEKFSQALDEYLKVPYLYPEANSWVKQAQLKCAQILERQGRLSEARAIYQTLADGYSREAELAGQKLKQLNNQPQP